MKPMSKAAEQKILTTLQEVARHVNDGLSPNAAIVKAAGHHGIPQGHIHLLTTAYNTGRATRQREEGADPLSKAASFELADAEAILRELYPDQVKTAAQLRRSQVVSSEYGSPPAFLTRRDSYERATAMELGQTKTASCLPAAETDSLGKQLNQLEFRRKRLETCRAEVSHARTKLAQLFARLEDYFSTPGSLSFGDVQKVAAIQHGRTGEAVFKHLLKNRPQFHKQAATGQWVDGQQPVFTWLQELVTTARAVKQAEAQYEQLQEYLQDQEHQIWEPHVHPTVGSCLTGLVPREKKASISAMMQLGILRGLSQNVGKNIATKPIDEQAVQKALFAMDDPRLNRELRAVQAGVLLNDLLVNDPEISQYDPQEVADAYNELAELAPSVVKHKALMVGLLRRRLEQGFLDPYDVGESVLKAEEKLRDQDRKDGDLTKPTGMGVGVGGVGVGKRPSLFPQQLGQAAVGQTKNLLRDTMLSNPQRVEQMAQQNFRPDYAQMEKAIHQQLQQKFLQEPPVLVSSPEQAKAMAEKSFQPDYKQLEKAIHQQLQQDYQDKVLPKKKSTP